MHETTFGSVLSFGARKSFYILFLIILILEVKSAASWTSDDLEIFDLVEEVNQNFYELLGVNQDSTAAEIRKAYRKLTLRYHPDKSNEPGTEEKFRQIVSVAEVLKDEEKRRTYDTVLAQGLPDWKQPIYYYRRVRKMSLVEMSVFLCVLFTLGHYIVAWSIYWERMYEIEEVIISKFKKKERKNRRKKNGTDTTEMPTPSSLGIDHILIPKPRYQDLLPIRLTCFLFYLVRSAPAYYQHWRETWLKKPILEEPSDDGSEPMVRKPRKRVKMELPDYSCIFQPVEAPNSGSSEGEESGEKAPAQDESPTEWTQADTLALIRAMNRFPGGTMARWQKIAHSLNRSEAEVTLRAKQLKSSNFAAQVPSAIQGLTGSEDTTPAVECAPDTRIPGESAEWTQSQQRALELAMKQFSKGHPDRWDHIALCVPDKSKEECMLRYKHLVELIRKKKITGAVST